LPIHCVTFIGLRWRIMGCCLSVLQILKAKWSENSVKFFLQNY